ncbi:MAG: M3 family oligoendopeptidase [Bacteroidetes bacterium]|nr:M3 family oligoendopeptidase [Bacteroidota bacterium]
MKFSEIPYNKPDINEIKIEFEELLTKFAACDSFEEQEKLYFEINKIIMDFYSDENVAAVRYSLDVNNKDYEELKEYFDNIRPDFQQLVMRFAKLFTSSKFLKEYSKKYGNFIIDNAKRGLLTFSDAIAEEFRQEAALETEYYKMKAEGTLNYAGQERTVNSMNKFLISSDRAVRKEANEAVLNFQESKVDRVNKIFDDVIKIRTSMARALGFKNFVELAYLRMEKSFSQEDVKKFRDNIHKYFVPLSIKLKERKRIRLGLDEVLYYDSPLKFKSGNPKPKGNPDWIVQQGVKMYSELSPETKEFIEFMTEYELFDLDSRKGKGGSGGYATYFYKYKYPFINGNMNGSSFDVYLFTHEAGHALQSYLCRNFSLMDEINTSSDLSEIHSMSMEFLTHDYMNLFFEEDTEKYIFGHFESSVNMLPHLAKADEFQEMIYSYPELTFEQRCSEWKMLQKKYGTEFKGSDNKYLNEGMSWLNRELFVSHPMYSIEYALAQMVAYQFLFLKKENHESAMRKYIDFCKLGGKYNFSQSLKIAGLKNPFEEETVKEMAEKMEELIDSIDDSKF